MRAKKIFQYCYIFLTFVINILYVTYGEYMINYYDILCFNETALFINFLLFWFFCVFLSDYTLPLKRLEKKNGNKMLHYDYEYDNSGLIKNIYYRISRSHIWYPLPNMIFNHKGKHRHQVIHINTDCRRVIDLIERYSLAIDDGERLTSNIVKSMILFFILIFYFIILLNN